MLESHQYLERPRKEPEVYFLRVLKSSKYNAPTSRRTQDRVVKNTGRHECYIRITGEREGKGNVTGNRGTNLPCTNLPFRLGDLHGSQRVKRNEGRTL